MHKLLRKRILVFVVVIGMVSLVNIIQQLVLTDLYTIAYPENLSDMQKNIDSNIIEINDKVVTKGSVVILATTNEKKQKLYHLERGSMTTKYRIRFIYEEFEPFSQFFLEDKFDRFSCQIEGMQIINDPTSFHINVDWFAVSMQWITPILCVYSIIIRFLEKH